MTLVSATLPSSSMNIAEYSLANGSAHNAPFPIGPIVPSFFVSPFAEKGPAGGRRWG